MLMTYGELPPKWDFKAQYAIEMGHKPYRMGNFSGREAELLGGSHTSMSADQLYAFLSRLVDAWEEGDEAAGTLASDILGTLGFEWV